MSQNIRRIFCLLVIAWGISDLWDNLAAMLPAEHRIEASDPIAEAAFEEGCDPKLLIAIHTTECDLADQSKCTSSAGAQGPFQFMPGTWVMYADPGWNVWDLESSARTACRMVQALQLELQQTKENFVIRFAGLDGGMVWNADQDQATDVWNLWKNTGG